MKMYVMVTDGAGNRFNPRLGGYEKKKCVYALTQKFPVVEVRHQPAGEMVYGYWKGDRLTAEELRIRLITHARQILLRLNQKS